MNSVNTLAGVIRIESNTEPGGKTITEKEFNNGTEIKIPTEAQR